MIAQDETMNVRNQRLSQVILHVQDMNKMVSFYRDKLELKLSYPVDIQDFSKQSWVTFDTGPCILALHSGGRMRIGEQPSHRITFEVEDVTRTREHFVNQGVQLGEVRSPAPGAWVVDGRDPEGNVYAFESHS